MKSEIQNKKKEKFGLSFDDLEEGSLYNYKDKENNSTGVILICIDVNDSSRRIVEINGDDNGYIWNTTDKDYLSDFEFKKFDGVLELSNN